MEMSPGARLDVRNSHFISSASIARQLPSLPEFAITGLLRSKAIHRRVELRFRRLMGARSARALAGTQEPQRKRLHSRDVLKACREPKRYRCGFARNLEAADTRSSPLRRPMRAILPTPSLDPGAKASESEKQTNNQEQQSERHGQWRTEEACVCHGAHRTPKNKAGPRWKRPAQLPSRPGEPKRKWCRGA